MSLVVIQRGHVPRTSGATGAPGEQYFAIDTAAELAPMIRAMGHYPRVIDADERRSRYAGDLFVSIHYDSASSNSASGASVGYQNDAGEEFAKAWKRHYKAEGWDRGFRSDNYTVALAQYYGVREAIAAGNYAAIITESGFQTNDGDRKLMSPTRTARSIARAVAEITGKQLEDDMDISELMQVEKEAAERSTPRGRNLSDWRRQQLEGAGLVNAIVTRVNEPEKIARAVIAELPEGGIDQATVEAAVRRVLGGLDEEPA